MNEKLTKLKNYLSLYKERSRRRLERMINSELVIFDNDKFVYKENGNEVENLRLKTEIDHEESLELEDSECSYLK